MAQRFNPPPGWQVPADFVPPQGWQPDPSWPPAPPNWNYWLDDGSQVPPGQGPRLTREQQLAQDLEAATVERRAALSQITIGLVGLVVFAVLLLAFDRLFLVVGVISVLAAIIGAVKYLGADRKVNGIKRELQPGQSGYGVAPSLQQYGGQNNPQNSAGSSQTPNVTQQSNLRNDDGTIPGQWKV